MTPLLAGLTGAATLAGLMQSLVASRLTTRLLRRSHLASPARPAVTVLKPLHGKEPLLEEALATICEQNYPEWQIVFGVRDAADEAVAIVRRLQTRFPRCDITLVTDSAMHGRNHKVGNLINMFPAARHNVLVIADSDVHAAPDYLERLVASLEQPGVGLVTALYAGLPAYGHVVTQLGATQITHCFLPSAVLGRAMGRQDCLGATMCLRRRELDWIGGLRVLADHLADDNVLGRKIAALGLKVALADAVVLTTVPETSLPALFRHELRWARTIRTLEPLGFAASVLQYPLAWALLTIIAASGAMWSIALFFAVWLLRAVAASFVDGALAGAWNKSEGRDDSSALAFRCPVWLLPIRDVLSVAVMVASYGGRRVDWRGHALDADSPARDRVPLRPIEEISSR